MEPTESNARSSERESLLTELDRLVIRLLQIGYLNQKQRDFLVEFIDKSEIPLLAAKSSLSCRIALATSEISSPFTPEHPNHAPVAFASISTTTACKGYKPRQVKRDAWGRIDPARNDDGDVIGNYAAPVGAVGTVNKGKSMMEKMGWTTGMGLGKKNNGIREPVAITVKIGSSGLGAGCSTSDPIATVSKSGLTAAFTPALGDKASTSDAVVDATEISDCGSSLDGIIAAEYNPEPETSAKEVVVGYVDADIEEIDEEELDQGRDRSVVIKTSKKSRKSRNKSGIDVCLIADGKNRKRSIKFSGFITSTRKTKQVWQQAGVIVKATSAQNAVPANRGTPGLIRVQIGDHLEIKARKLGFGYEATNLRTKESGIVKIAFLFMTEYNEPDESVEIWKGNSWSPIRSGGNGC